MRWAGYGPGNAFLRSSKAAVDERVRGIMSEHCPAFLLIQWIQWAVLLSSLKLSHLQFKKNEGNEKFAASGKFKQAIQARHKQATGTQEAGRRSVAAESSEKQSGKAGLRRIAAGDVDIDGVDHDEGPSNPPKVSSMRESNAKPVSVKNRFSPQRKT